jgi:serine/threonine protein kinase
MIRPDSHSNPSAEVVFDDYVRRCEAGEDVDFAAVCAAHPSLADALRRCAAARAAIARLMPEPLVDADDQPARSTSVRTAQARDESEGAPEADSDAGDASALWEQLRRQGPRGARYQVVREIARGGMGAVLKVRDKELRRKLAMKVVLAKGEELSDAPPRASARTVSRFLEEAQITSQLDHPGIVPVHDIGIGQDGRVYFTMRLVQGKTLSDILEHVKDGGVGWMQWRMLDVLRKVCEAMAYAHSRGVIHRDLKPSNVMVGAFGEVYVMDWGLARVLGREDQHDLRLAEASEASVSAVATERHEQRETTPDSPLVTRDGDVLGTPAYMSPEQANSQLELIGPQTDVYAVGAMLYHLLSGQMPYVPAGARVSAESVRWRVREGPPKSLHEVARATPVELVAICDKAMAREVGDRYADMEALGGDLRAYLERRTVKAYRTGAWAEARMWVRRNRALAAALGAAVWALVVGFVMAGRALRMAKEVQRMAEEGQLAAERGRGEAQKLRDQAAVHADLHVTQARLERLFAQYGDWDFVVPAPHSQAREWLLSSASMLVEEPADPQHFSGRRPGLATFRRVLKMQQLASDASGGSPEATEGLDALHDSPELTAKSAKRQWYARMLGHEQWPDLAPLQRRLYVEHRHTAAKRLNEIAWMHVDPRHPRPGFEQEGLVLSDMAVKRCMASLVAKCVLEQQVDQLAALYLYLSLDTMAWALFRTGKFDACRRAAQDAEGLGKFLNLRHDPTTPSFDTMIATWRSEAELVFPGLSAEVDRLKAERDWQRGRAEPVDRRLVDVVTKLERLQALLDDERAQATISTWDAAIAAIEKHPQYGGLRLTRQVGLVPLDPDPDSKLWEFAHLPSGPQAKRNADGRLDMKPNTGMVFVLVPGASPTVTDGDTLDPRRKVVLDPFFLSKFEMTQGQWEQLAPGSKAYLGVPGPGRAVRGVSYETCVDVLCAAGGWLRLPSRAQWEYACWPEGAPMPKAWRTQPPTEYDDTGGLNDVVQTTPNSFGIHGMLGSVYEWCEDGAAQVLPRSGDGLRLAPGYQIQNQLGRWQWQPGQTQSPWEEPMGRNTSNPGSGLRPARKVMP